MTRGNGLGIVTRRVSQNLRALRQEQELSTYELARKLGAAGWPIGAHDVEAIVIALEVPYTNPRHCASYHQGPVNGWAK